MFLLRAHIVLLLLLAAVSQNVTARAQGAAAEASVAEELPPGEAAPQDPGEENPDYITPFSARHIITFYPFSLTGGHLMLGYEHRLNDRWSLRLNGGFGLSEEMNYYDIYTVGDYRDVKDMTAHYVELQARYYILGRRLNGAYAGPYALNKGKYFTVEVGSRTDSNPANEPLFRNKRLMATGGGVLVGYQTIFQRFTADVYFGGGMLYSLGDTDVLNEVPVDNYVTGVHYHAGFAVGMALGD